MEIRDAEGWKAVIFSASNQSALQGFLNVGSVSL